MAQVPAENICVISVICVRQTNKNILCPLLNLLKTNRHNLATMYT